MWKQYGEIRASLLSKTLALENSKSALCSLYLSLSSSNLGSWTGQPLDTVAHSSETQNTEMAQLHLRQIKFASSNTVQWCETRDAMWVHLGMHFWPKWKCWFRPCELSFLQSKGKICSVLDIFKVLFWE